MLFRKNNGEMIEIKRYDFPNDKLYYAKIMEIKSPLFRENLPKLESPTKIL